MARGRLIELGPFSLEPDSIGVTSQDSLIDSDFPFNPVFGRVQRSSIMSDGSENSRISRQSTRSLSSTTSSSSYPPLPEPNYLPVFGINGFETISTHAASAMRTSPSEMAGYDTSQVGNSRSYMTGSNFESGIPMYPERYKYPDPDGVFLEEMSAWDPQSQFPMELEIDGYGNPSPYRGMRTFDQEVVPSTQQAGRGVICKQAGCGKYYGKKAEMERHFRSDHEGAGIICGDCQNDGKNRFDKRKDHFQEHIQRDHGYEKTLREPCKKCPECRPENKKHQLQFSTQASLDLHMVHNHSRKSASGATSLEHGTAQEQEDGQTSSNSKRACDGGKPGAKRPKSDKAISTQSRTEKYQSLSGGIDTTSHNLTADKENHLRLDSSTVELTPNNHVNSRGISNGQYEEYIINVSLADFVRAKNFLNSIHQLCKPIRISFDVPHRRIKLRGPAELVGQQKPIIDSQLKFIRFSTCSEPLANISPNSREKMYSDFTTPVVPQKELRHSQKVFTIRKKEDAELLKLWMEKIIPGLFAILDESIGKEYSASLVREGCNSEEATAVIRIESPQIPRRIIREDIRSRLDKVCDGQLELLQVHIQFLVGSLVLLAGGRAGGTTDESEDAKRPLPYYARYWKYPGMGASIGLLCNKYEFATLGCYIEADGETFILTVDHVVQKACGKRVEGDAHEKEPLTSPAISKVNKIKKDLGILLFSLNAELDIEFRRQFGNPNDLDPSVKISDSIQELVDKQEFVKSFLEEVTENNDFTIGQLAHRCNLNSTAPLSNSHSTLGTTATVVGDTPERPAQMRHRLDWALFKVTSRMGNNRHRYKYNLDDKSTEFHPRDANLEYGEGVICHETCAIVGNEKVFYVGQSDNGRLEGEINAALRAVAHGDLKTVEHHIIICDEQRRPGEEYAGDSGAVVLRCSDNKMVALVCASYGKDPLITPIRAVFDDIKTNLGVNRVDLPGAPDPASQADQITLISGSEKDAPEQRPYKSSDIELPKLSLEEQLARPKASIASLLQLLKDRKLDTTPPIDVAMERPPSPTPSLSYSRTPSPSSTPVSRSPTLMDLTPISTRSTTPVFIAGEEFEDSEYPRSTGSYQPPTWDQLQSYILRAQSKLSIPYILCDDVNQIKKTQRGYSKPLSSKLIRSYKTW